MRGKFCFRHELGMILVAIYLICCLVPGVLHAQQKQKIHDDLLSVGFPNEKDGWVCGRRGTVLHTADGGKTWVRQNSNTGFTLSSICFVDSQNGWAVGDEGVIIHTENGGKTSEKQKSPVPVALMKTYTYKDKEQYPGLKELMYPDLYQRFKPGAPPHA